MAATVPSPRAAAPGEAWRGGLAGAASTALARVERKFPAEDVTAAYSSPTIEIDGESICVKASEILWIKAQQNYSMVSIMGGGMPVMVPKSMADWESALASEIFVRLVRSVIVNVSHIQTVSWLSRDETLVAFLKDSHPLRLGRTAAQRLKIRLKNGR